MQRLQGLTADGAGGTLVGLAFYAALFAAYQRFYSELDLQPEDVGVGYGFLLVRSIAFGLIIAGILGYLAIGIRVTFLREPRRVFAKLHLSTSLLIALIVTNALVPLFLILVHMTSDRTAEPVELFGAWTGSSLTVAGDLVILIRLFGPVMVAISFARLTFIIMTTAVAIGMTGALVTSAGYLGGKVRDGQAVAPWTVLGCLFSTSQHPPPLSNGSGHRHSDRSKYLRMVTRQSASCS